MKLKNIWRALKDQMPLSRAFKNFILTRNAWGLFSINSHVSQGSGKPKVMYNTARSARKAGDAMQKKTGFYYSSYKCMRCDGFHIGRNRDSKGNYATSN